jgi:hypothetical protein
MGGEQIDARRWETLNNKRNKMMIDNLKKAQQSSKLTIGRRELPENREYASGA